MKTDSPTPSAEFHFQVCHLSRGINQAQLQVREENMTAWKWWLSTVFQPFGIYIYIVAISGTVKSQRTTFKQIEAQLFRSSLDIPWQHSAAAGPKPVLRNREWDDWLRRDFLNDRIQKCSERRDLKTPWLPSCWQVTRPGEASARRRPMAPLVTGHRSRDGTVGSGTLQGVHSDGKELFRPSGGSWPGVSRKNAWYRHIYIYRLYHIVDSCWLTDSLLIQMKQFILLVVSCLKCLAMITKVGNLPHSFMIKHAGLPTDALELLHGSSTARKARGKGWKRNNRSDSTTCSSLSF